MAHGILLRSAFRCASASGARQLTRVPWHGLIYLSRQQVRHGSSGGPIEYSRGGPGIPPEALEKPRPPKQRKPRRRGRFLRVLGFATVALGVGYVVDTQLYASSITRSMRSFGLGIYVAADYKLNFREHPLTGGTIADLHRRTAERLFNLLRDNGGLYLKIGQAIAMQSAVLPPEFQQMFARMFDDAPQNGWEDVVRVVKEDFGGRTPEEVFGISFTNEPGKGVMEREARASASVAQVHWARLADGREVAIKVQKREIAQQVAWDLWAFKVITWVYSKSFNLPFYSLVPYISERLMLETDFQNEAHNASRMAELVANEPRLRDRVYIPQVIPEYSSKRIMVTEWIEGVRLWDKDSITKRWHGGWRQGSPGCDGTPLDGPSNQAIDRELSKPDGKERIKPERAAWKGKHGDGGLGVSLKEVMTSMVDLFSAQMFLWGLVHCDPHPGNIFIRRKRNGHSELVLIDHGLYIELSPDFRHQYCTFWKSLLAFDNKKIAEVTKGWGINAPDMFASATLMRPYTGGDGSTRQEISKKLEGKTAAERHFEMQERMRKQVRDMLGDEKKWPRELIFIGRNMRIVQGNNQFLGSPVNRIKMTGLWASRSLIESKELPLGERLGNALRHALFRVVLVGSDFVFFTSRVRQWLGLGGGMEDDLEKQMQGIAKDMGIELNHGVFDG